MKKYLLITVALIAAFGCSKEILSEQPVGDINLKPTPPHGEVIGEVNEPFAFLNLDYPGLEKVKEFNEKGDLYNALTSLVDYWRTRPVYNPEANVLSPSATASEQNIADQATAEAGWRFKVAVYAEDSGTVGQEKYWSFAAEDGSIDWNTVPAGLENEKEFLAQKHRLQWMLPQAKTYAVTKDEKYFKSWFEAWKSYNIAFPVPEGKTDATPWSGLQPCCRMNDLMAALPYYAQSPSLTPNELIFILRTIYLHIESIRINRWADQSANISLTQEQAIVSAGILFPEFTKAEEWLKDGGTALAAQLKSQFNEDGVHNEFDISYHLGVVADFISIYKTAQMNARESELPADYTECLRKAAGFIKDVIYPNYSTDNFNDTRSKRMTKSVLLKNLRKYSEMFPEDEQMKWMATEGKFGTKPSATLVTYPVTGYYMMRNGWTANSTMLVHKNNYDTGWKWHNQSDNGTIGLYVNGRRFLPDAGCYTYNDGSDRRTYASTEMHNVVTKARKSYEKREGKLLLAENTTGYDVLVTENPAYSDLTIRRAIFFVDNSYYVIVDEAYGDCADTQINLNFKLWGGAKEEENESGKAYTATKAEVENRSFSAKSLFTDGNNLIIKSFSETADNLTTETGTGYFSNEIGNTVQRVWFRLNVDKKADKAGRFISVLVPFSDKQPKIEAEFTDNTEDSAGTFHPEGVSLKVSVNGSPQSLSYRLK